MAKQNQAQRSRFVPAMDFKARSSTELRRLARRQKRPLLWYHEVGMILKREVPVVAGEKRRGAIRRIAEVYFGDVRFASTLYGCRRFAEVVDRPEVIGDMDGLSWAAAHYLMSVQNRRLRAAIVKKVLKDGLKAREVRLLIQERLGKRSGGGRTTKVPKLGPLSALRATESISKDWVRHCEKWSQVVIEEDADRKSRSPRPADQDRWPKLIEAARSAIRVLGEVAATLLKKLPTGGRSKAKPKSRPPKNAMRKERKRGAG